MKSLIYLALLLTSCLFHAQNISIQEFNSTELGRSRNLKIYVPESYAKDSTRLYPLTIIFDGDYLFDVYTANAKLFAKRDKAPEQIIVGIMQNENKERYRDCSYDELNGLPTEDSNRFYRFIRAELLDFLEYTYRLSPFRTLVGNTLTANFVNYFTIENDLAFDAFVNINPYYNKDMGMFLQNKFSDTKHNKIYYYLSSGSYNSPKKHKRIEDVAYFFNNLEDENFLFKYDEFKSTKTASIGQSIPVALAHIFDIYSAISSDEFSLNIKDLAPPDAIDYVKNKYIEIEYLFGTNMPIRERDIYAIESIVIDQENGDYLAELGEMIHKLNPKSPLSDYYIGMFYEKTGRYKRALKHYKNGYAKIDEDSSSAEAYYQNIERVLNRKDEIIIQEELEKKERKDNKKQWKEERKEERKEYRKNKDE